MAILNSGPKLGTCKNEPTNQIWSRKTPEGMRCEHDFPPRGSRNGGKSVTKAPSSLSKKDLHTLSAKNRIVGEEEKGVTRSEQNKL